MKIWCVAEEPKQVSQGGIAPEDVFEPVPAAASHDLSVICVIMTSISMIIQNGPCRILHNTSTVVCQSLKKQYYSSKNNLSVIPC